MLSDEKILNIKENQTLIGVLDSYENKEKLDNLAKKINLFSLELLENYQSSINGHTIFSGKSCWL